MNQHQFTDSEIEGVYRAIYERRDMRHFTSAALAPDQLRRFLLAAHRGPSVGYMQPWRFLRVVAPELRQICVVVNLPHGHIWTFNEVDQFVDGVLLGAAPPPRIGRQNTKGGEVRSQIILPTKLKEAFLNYTADTGDWSKRRWETRPAEIESGVIRARLSQPHPRVWFLSATDERGLRVSTEHEELATE